MGKDFAFMFYPGDYLRDTQCLSERTQVSYDRIMCEHMRNICISQAQLNFFTKRLNEEEKQELKMVLTKVDGGFQIDWVVKSILKRLNYSESRSKNRLSKKKNISKTYDIDMENENRIDNIEFNWGKESTDFLNDKIWIEQVCMTKGVEIAKLKKSMKHFVTDLTLKADFKPVADIKSHYLNYFNRHGLNGAIKASTDENELESQRIAPEQYFTEQ